MKSWEGPFSLGFAGYQEISLLFFRWWSPVGIARTETTHNFTPPPPPPQKKKKSE